MNKHREEENSTFGHWMSSHREEELFATCLQTKLGMKVRRRLVLPLSTCFKSIITVNFLPPPLFRNLEVFSVSSRLKFSRLLTQFTLISVETTGTLSPLHSSSSVCFPGILWIALTTLRTIGTGLLPIPRLLPPFKGYSSQKKRLRWDMYVSLN